ncbi:conserved hypothetical protein [Culex quinquefasciatus]|uniref:Splicing factor, arginine/serine-rich 18 n=1 Tax=Culex quinquefasciatus TaxID=7176 RepID=B0WHV4_CULQU|nr:conserved hypothetical protein [Culex quinquefasciatus]|eukprot:XP_001848288.1 conserved hypothetical protein [Culex quinquefasciatus]
MYARSGRNGAGQNGANPGARAGMAAAITPVVKNYQTVRSSSSDGTDWNSLNPNLYQNMSNDQVDWAALAQQWIQMKETLPPEMVPAAPPPPPVISWNQSPPAAATLETIDEQGEAPMEVEKEEDPGQQAQQRPQPSSWQNGSIAWQYPTVTAPEWRSSAWETSWSTGGNQGGNSGSVPPPAVNPQASVAVANWQAKMSRIYKMNDGSGSSVSSEPIAGTVQPATANSKQVEQGSKRIPGLMDQVINLDHAAEDAGQADQDQGEDTTQTINDAKRKLLPAWIREGLEKMEREKQRQVERERDQKQREQLLEQRRQAELEALSELESAKKKSKFESDSEEEEAPDEQEGPSREASPVPARSREEILQELMISVRKNLTEILLEVTNEEIAVLAKETLAKARRKGLGMYGDSDDEDEDDEDASGSEKRRDSSDGENEEDDEEIEKALRSTIKQRQKEFEWTAREIEDQLAQEEARDERKRREYEQQQQTQKDQNSDDEDAYGGRAGFGHAASGTAVGSGSVSGGRTRDKRISRFSDPKDTVRQTHITHVAIVPHKPGEIVPPAMHLPKSNQMAPTATMVSSGISPPVVLNPSASAPLFPAAVSGLESYRRESSVASEAPSTSSRASHRSGAAVKTKTTGMIATWLTTIGTRSTRPRVDHVVPNAAAIRVVIGGPTRGTHGTILAVMAAVAEGQDRHVTIAIIGIDPREDREAALGHLCPGGEGIRECLNCTETFGLRVQPPPAIPPE